MNHRPISSELDNPLKHQKNYNFMKTATVRDLRYDFPKIEAWLEGGEEIIITKHSKPIPFAKSSCAKM
jgi:hypothetical protein